MAAKRNYSLRSVIALGVILFLYPTLSPAAEGKGSLEERIQVLEKAQAEKKASQPVSYTYNPRKGVLLEAADESWGLLFSGRFHYRAMFWDDQLINDHSDFSQGDLALRRLRPNFEYYWDHGFYKTQIELDIDSTLGVGMQSGSLAVDFPQLNSFLPVLTVGPKVSSFFNKHDTNWGSSTGGLFDRSMFQDGAGIGSGSQYNAMSLTWDKVPVGPGTMFFEALYSNNGVVSAEDEDRPKTSKRSVHFGWNYEPFSKTKNTWIEGIDLGIGYQLDHVLPGEDGRGLFRVRTTERMRLVLIEVARDLKPESQRIYVTPGFGWKVGPNWLRTAYSWNSGTLDDNGDVEGRMFRVADELFVWSPKGFFTGSAKTAKSLMLFAGFERDDYEADNHGIRGGFENASASNFNFGLWYHVRPGLRVGAEYGRYWVDKMGRGASSLEDVSVGDDIGFDTLEFGMTFDF